MEIGNKSLELRKNAKLSQEQLAEKMDVTRQTISKWELGETTPDIKQAKELSKIFNVSLDELTNNDIKNLLVEKVSNTEKLAGLVLKVLRWLGIIFIIVLIIDIISLLVVAYVKNKDGVDSNKVIETSLSCSIEKNDYLITVGSDGYFNCSNCSIDIQKELKDNYIDFSDIKKTSNNIKDYFKNNNGICE